MIILGLTGSIATGKSTVSKILGAPPYSIPIVDCDVIAREVVEPGTRSYFQIVAAFESSVSGLLLVQPRPSSEESSQQRSSSSSPSSSSSSSWPKSTLPPINRTALSSAVFGPTPTHAAARAKLNSIIHPAVARATVFKLMKAYLSGAWCVVLDVPLLYEVGASALISSLGDGDGDGDGVDNQSSCDRDHVRKQNQHNNHHHHTVGAAPKVDRFESICTTIAVVTVASFDQQMARLVGRDPHLTHHAALARIQAQVPVSFKVLLAYDRKRYLDDASDSGADVTSSSSSSSSPVLQPKSKSTSKVGKSTSASTADDNDNNNNSLHPFSSPPPPPSSSSTHAFVLSNDSDINNLQTQVASMIARLKKLNPPWWNTFLWAFPPLAIILFLKTMLTNRRLQLGRVERLHQRATQLIMLEHNRRTKLTSTSNTSAAGDGDSDGDGSGITKDSTLLHSPRSKF